MDDCGGCSDVHLSTNGAMAAHGNHFLSGTVLFVLHSHIFSGASKIKRSSQ